MHRSGVKEQFPGINEQRELKSLERAIPYVRPPTKNGTTPGKILIASPDDWFGTIVALRKLHVIKNEVPLDSFLDMTFIQNYYDTEAKGQ